MWVARTVVGRGNSQREEERVKSTATWNERRGEGCGEGEANAQLGWFQGEKPQWGWSKRQNLQFNKIFEIFSLKSFRVILNFEIHHGLNFWFIDFRIKVLVLCLFSETLYRVKFSTLKLFWLKENIPIAEKLVLLFEQPIKCGTEETSKSKPYPFFTSYNIFYIYRLPDRSAVLQGWVFAVASVVARCLVIWRDCATPYFRSDKVRCYQYQCSSSCTA